MLQVRELEKKKIKILKYSIVLFLFSIMIQLGFAQDIDEPDPPVIQFVSVDTITGQTSIQWLPSPSTDVEFYTLYYDLEFDGIYDLMDTVQASDPLFYTTSTSYANSQRVAYIVLAVDSASNRSNFPDEHHTMFAEAVFDSCQAQVTIQWTKYVGWINLVEYNIFSSINGASFSKIADVSASLSDTISYVLNDIIENSSYCFYIKAINVDPLVSSTSNSVCVNTNMKIKPSYINADYATVSSDNQIDLSFTIDPSSEIDDYKLLRSSDSAGPFDTIQTFTNSNDNIQITDDNINAATEIYYYQLAAINSCGNIVTRSNLASNIVLNVINNGTLNSLSWNEYINWNGGVEMYSVYRILDENSALIINTLDSEFVDNIENFLNRQTSGQFCYYIEAIETDNNPYGEKGLSRSTTVCVTLEPNIYVPNAINPKSDIEENRYFRPQISYRPENYTLVIRDRWGGIVFESSDSTIGWDGMLNGGKYAPEGAYIFVITMVTPDNEVINRNGSLIVVYP